MQVRDLPTDDSGMVDEAAAKAFRSRLAAAINRSQAGVESPQATPMAPQRAESEDAAGPSEPPASAIEAVRFLMLTMPRRLPMLWGTTAALQFILGTNIAMAAYLIKYIVQALVPFGSSTSASTSPTTATSTAEEGLAHLNKLVKALVPFGASIGDDAGDYSAVVLAFSVYAGVSLLLPVIGFMFAHSSSSMIARMEAELRRQLTLHIMSRGTQFFADRSAGELNAAFSTDVPMITVCCPVRP